MSIKSKAQKDSLNNKLTFDLGFGRITHINAFPIFKDVKRNEKSELDILFPLFSKTKDSIEKTHHLQILPFLINTANKQGTDFRILSLFYP